MVANLTLATATAFRTSRATGRTAPEWHTLVPSSAPPEIVRDYVKKGSKLYIEGKLQTRSWDDKETGAKKYRTEIIVNELVLLTSREEGGAPASVRSEARRPALTSARRPAWTTSPNPPKSPTTTFRFNRDQDQLAAKRSVRCSNAGGQAKVGQAETFVQAERSK